MLNHRLPDEKSIKIADHYVIDSALRIDPQVMVIKSVGSIAEARPLKYDSDFDYVVLSSSPSVQGISVANKDGQKYRCVNNNVPRPLQVHWYSLNNLIDKAINFDFGDHLWHLAQVYQYVVWYDLYSKHEPLYITQHGREFIKKSPLFINRDSVLYVLRSVEVTSELLNSIDRWVGCHYKYAKANLMGLEMCIKAIEGTLFPFDVRTVPNMPNKTKYRRISDDLIHQIKSYNLVNIFAPQDNESITLLKV